MTEESIRILLSLCVMIEQNFFALIFYEKHLAKDVLKSKIIPSRSDDCVDEAVLESLWFQIILKSCAFLEEWDEFLGVKTTLEDNNRLLLIKKIVAPARREIAKWKDLKTFRNHVIAHNLRNSKKEFSLDDMHTYDCPQTNEELYYLVSFIQRMTKVLSNNYPKETLNALEKAKTALDDKNYSEKGERDLKKALEEIDENISINIWSVIRFDIIKQNVKAIVDYKNNQDGSPHP
jgi:hypothetical protein